MKLVDSWKFCRIYFVISVVDVLRKIYSSSNVRLTGAQFDFLLVVCICTVVCLANINYSVAGVLNFLSN